MIWTCLMSGSHIEKVCTYHKYTELRSIDMLLLDRFIYNINSLDKIFTQYQFTQ